MNLRESIRKSLSIQEAFKFPYLYHGTHGKDRISGVKSHGIQTSPLGDHAGENDPPERSDDLDRAYVSASPETSMPYTVKRASALVGDRDNGKAPPKVREPKNWKDRAIFVLDRNHPSVKGLHLDYDYGLGSVKDRHLSFYKSDAIHKDAVVDVIDSPEKYKKHKDMFRSKVDPVFSRRDSAEKSKGYRDWKGNSLSTSKQDEFNAVFTKHGFKSKPPSSMGTVDWTKRHGKTSIVSSTHPGMEDTVEPRSFWRSSEDKDYWHQKIHGKFTPSDLDNHFSDLFSKK